MQDRDGKTAIESFIRQLKSAASAILLLDYDGTLAPFHIDRSNAYPYRGIIPILDRITRSGKTRVIVISGRPARELLNLLDPLEKIEIWGAHGLEHLLPDGTYQSTPVNMEVLTVLEQAEEWMRTAGLLDIAETKPGGIAIHWRGLPDPEIERLKARIGEGWNKLATNPNLRLLNFDGGIELRIARPNKGDAISAILDGADPDTPVAFLGDDFTDEDAFRAIGGRGLSILVHPVYRKTIADGWIRPPQELIQFLERWSEALSS